MISKINFNSLNSANYLSFQGKNDLPALRQKINFEETGDGFTLETEIKDGVMLQHYNPAITTSQKNFMEKVRTLITPNEDGTVTLKDKDGNITELPRTLSVDEINALKAMGAINKNDKIKDFVQMVDSGIEMYAALEILTSAKTVVENYKNATIEGVYRSEEGEIELQRPLSNEEACAIFRQRGKKPDGTKIRNFIDLRDTYGVDIKSALAISKSDVKTQRFLTLVTPDENGGLILEDKEGVVTTLKRAFTPQEAIVGLVFDDDKLVPYQAILDKGVDIKNAAWASKDDRRSAKFLALTTACEDGKARVPLQDGSFMVLDRALSADEAIIVLEERFINPKIEKQINEDGRIHSTKRYVGDKIIY